MDNLHDRFYALVDKTDGCWIWRGGRGGKGASVYGVMRVAKDAPHTSAHRIAWELERSTIPTGMVIDHLCGNTLCVNPDHLEPVTPQENRRRQSARKTHCRHGHPLVAENVYVDTRGHRSCLTCRSRRDRWPTDPGERERKRARHREYMREWRRRR